MVMSRDWNAVASHRINIYNSSFERVDEFKYLGTTSTNQNPMQDEMKCTLKSGNVFYHSVLNIFPSSFLTKNIKIKPYSTIILPVVLYGCEIWPLKLREGPRLRWCENRVLRRIFGPKRDKTTGEWRKLYNKYRY